MANFFFLLNVNFHRSGLYNFAFGRDIHMTLIVVYFCTTMQSYNSTSRRLRLNSHTNSQLNSQPKQSSPVLKLPQPNTAQCSPVQPRPAKTSQLNRPYTLCVLSFSAFFFPREQFHFGNKCGNKSRWLLLLSFDSCFHSCTKVLVFLENILTLNKVLSQRV